MPLSGDLDTLFIASASSLTGEIGSVRNWVKLRLGYPTLEVELKNVQIDAAFEESVIVYSAEIAKFKSKNSYLQLLGIKKDTNLSLKSPVPSTKFIKRYIAQFGTDAGSGGRVDYIKSFFVTQAGRTRYSFNELRSTDQATFGQSVSASVTGYVIPFHVYHVKPPSGYRHFDPMQGSNFLLYREFGSSDAYAINSRLLYSMPLYENLLRFQWFENFDKMFKAQFVWNIVGNEIYLSPTPQNSMKVFMEWQDSTVIDNAYSDLLDGIDEASLSAYTTDITNIPFQNVEYDQINDFSKNWIRQFTLAICKELLGLVRGKMLSIPVPDSEVSLNYAELLIEGKEQQLALKEEIKEFLDSIISSEALKREGEILDVTDKYLKKTPLRLYMR